MVVCSCHGVNERRVRREIERGAATIEEVAAACRAGSCCLSCHPTIGDLLTEHAAARPAVGLTVRGRRRMHFA